MIPNLELLTEEITEQTYPTRTYKINFSTDIADRHALTVNSKGELDIVGQNSLSGFTIDDDGTVSISYNAQLAGYELSQDAQGILGLTLKSELEGKDRISGYIDDLDALIQAIYLILSTERYQYLIYSWDYGIELLDLFGKPMSYVTAELPRRIKDALMQDSRVKDVKDFTFTRKGKQLATQFTVVSDIANVSTELEVRV